MTFVDLWPFALSVGIFGLIIGSFLNVVVHRLPLMMERDWRQQSREFLGLEVEPEPLFNLARPASHCPACKQSLRWRDNIPLLSFLFLRGRCRACKARISLRYPVLELTSACLAVFIALQFGLSWQAFFALIFAWTLLALSAIDIDTQLLPDSLTLPLLWLGLLINAQGLFVTPSAAIIGAVAGYVVLWCVYWLFKLLTGREGMGFGDFKLLAALGAWLGWQALPLIILLSSVVGAVVGIALIVLRGRDRHAAIPFGPYLAAAGFIALVWGPELANVLLGGVLL
jgi:Type II secretory pathway, prepilin signal peptidase PulO and related peptidases